MKNYRKKNKSNQYGRSILEILFTLMIVGLLSVIGILAFPKMLEKYRQQRILEEVISIANNIRSVYLQTTGYPGLNNQTAIELGTISSNMIKEDNVTIIHANKNNIVITVPTNLRESHFNGAVFEISTENLNKKECLFLASQNLDSSISEIYRIGIGNQSSNTYYYNDEMKSITLEILDNLCDCEIVGDTSSYCKVKLSFF